MDGPGALALSASSSSVGRCRLFGADYRREYASAVA